MEKTFKVDIVTQGSPTITAQIQALHTKSHGGEVEFRANHTPIIISTVPAATNIIKEDGSNEVYFTSSGIIVVENNLMKFCCDSAEKLEEIDLSRAMESKARAEARLKDSKKENIDEERAKLALYRAVARISIVEKYRN
ncbi:MAG: ATP synthase delta/epsilon chain alpha-helix domain-containing protein [Clostridium sp.]